MDEIIYVKLSPATAKNKKLKMEFFNKDKKRLKTSQFGSSPNKDYTIYYKDDMKKAEIEKKKYIARHKVRENWNLPTTNGALSKWILWNKPTISSSFKDFMKNFNFKELK